MSPGVPNISRAAINDVKGVFNSWDTREKKCSWDRCASSSCRIWSLFLTAVHCRQANVVQSGRYMLPSVPFRLAKARMFKHIATLVGTPMP